MTQMADKYYVVWKGRKPGIYETWKTCEEQVKGYKGAEYKSYKTQEEAKEAYEDGRKPPAREREVEQERESERKNAGACVSKRKSRPLIPDDPSKYTAATKEALERVLGRTGE